MTFSIRRGVLLNIMEICSGNVMHTEGEDSDPEEFQFQPWMVSSEVKTAEFKQPGYYAWPQANLKRPSGQQGHTVPSGIHRSSNQGNDDLEFMDPVEPTDGHSAKTTKNLMRPPINYHSDEDLEVIKKVVQRAINYGSGFETNMTFVCHDAEVDMIINPD
eukprot:Protomagalhaensia_wolfi_Nauph_80__4324@NODE_4416_length_574_cov_4_046729_g3197_i1_p1_GENE_NODE_4416_length_574_cov_4_046729_g3197_i1NODE_4416_length_574_cov_4_046729_g3197_i1_p1_ORF_typecomplete_len160_score23_56_NODE_4416_length_574_cov_4_046729_g3197_i12481